MNERGSFETWYRQFVTVAAAILAMALIGVSVCDFLVDRYQWRLAHGEIRHPDSLASFVPPLKMAARDPNALPSF